jgi:hypothetical protein
MNKAMSEPHYFTYSEWLSWTVEKIVTNASSLIDPLDRDDYLRIQIKAALGQSFRHGSSGLGDNDPVTP